MSNRRDYVIAHALCITSAAASSGGPESILAPVTRYAHGLWADGCLVDQVILGVMIDDGTGTDAAGIRASLRVDKLVDGHDGQIAGAVDDHIACELDLHAELTRVP